MPSFLPSHETKFYAGGRAGGLLQFGVDVFSKCIVCCLFIYLQAVPGHALLWLILVKCKRSVSSLLQVSAVQHKFG
jgi:hypothetical protein